MSKINEKNNLAKKYHTIFHEIASELGTNDQFVDLIANIVEKFLKKEEK